MLTHHTILKILQKKSFIFFCAVLISLTIGYFLGLSIQKNRYSHFLESFRIIRENSSKYKLINPLIGGISAPATSIGVYTDIKQDILSYIKKEGAEVGGYSFYFRDLNTGLWFGSNEGIEFFPASLFKLPVAIAVYKQGEDYPGFLSQMSVYTQELDTINSLVGSNAKSVLEVGKAYQTEELVTIMLKNSDNGAKNLLLSILKKQYLDNIFNTVSLVSPDSQKAYTISSREYALFLRVLYGSSYINEEHSEHLLSLLNDSTFTDGLVAGVPRGVMVAHKFGTYDSEEEVNGTKVIMKQLHDCGVIYHPVNPYVLCIMTKGKDPTVLFRVISKISTLVYLYQDSRE